MEEMRKGAAGFRQVQEWVAAERFPEAIGLIEELLADPNLGRSRRAQLHGLACWIYDGPLKQSGPQAVLHGEEAVRLAELLHDPWHRADAQAHLIGARIHMGDLCGARRELERLQAAVDQMPDLLSDGIRTLFILHLLLAAASGDWADCLDRLADLAPQPDDPEIELIRAWATLAAGAPPDQVRRGLPPVVPDPILAAERILLEALLARAEGAPADPDAAHTARLRLAAAGRRDLLKRLALPQAPEDQGGHRSGRHGQEG